MRTCQSTWRVLLVMTVMTVLSGVSGSPVMAQEDEAVNRRPLNLDQLPEHNTPSTPSLQPAHGRATMASRFPWALTRAGREAGQEHFLGMSWLTLPTSPADDDVIAEHRFHNGRHIVSSLAILDADDPTRPTTSTDTFLDTYDVSAIGSVRVKF